MTAIESLRKWLKDCPAIDGQDAVIRLNYLSAEPMEFSIEDAPAAPVLKHYLRGAGDIRQKNYVLASRTTCCEADAVQKISSGLFDEITDWIWEQDNAGNRPDMGEKIQVLAVAATTSGYVIENSSSTCRIQLQMTIQYFKKG